MSSKQKLVSLALGSTFALASMGAVAANAENPFSASSLSSGYQVAANHEKGKEGKCGEAKCGAKDEKKEEAKCGAKDDKKGEASCGGKK
ncbi:MAG: hypothetical protein LPJ91_10765 [Pseudazoarcus pumilus]|nr:hypothetical protein [Pseudazoarcus pumilus]